MSCYIAQKIQEKNLHLYHAHWNYLTGRRDGSENNRFKVNLRLLKRWSDRFAGVFPPFFSATLASVSRRWSFQNLNSKLDFLYIHWSLETQDQTNNHYCLTRISLISKDTCYTAGKMGENPREREKRLMHNVHNHVPEMKVQATLVSKFNLITGWITVQPMFLQRSAAHRGKHWTSLNTLPAMNP